MHDAGVALTAVAPAAPTGETTQPATPSLWHLLSPKFFAARTRPLGKYRESHGRLVLFVTVGGIFWLFVFGLVPAVELFRGIPEIGALLAPSCSA